jgi:hypothetical protein
MRKSEIRSIGETIGEFYATYASTCLLILIFWSEISVVTPLFLVLRAAVL